MIGCQGRLAQLAWAPGGLSRKANPDFPAPHFSQGWSSVQKGLADSMPSNKSPAFQFYPTDFLADENVALMGLAARGAYITLMSHCWLEGTIPEDPAAIAGLCVTVDGPLDSTAMAELWETIGPCFKPARKEGRLKHPRLDKERRKQRLNAKLKSEAGKAGAEKRWRDKGKSASQTHSTAIADPMAKNSSSSSIPTSIPTPDKNKKASPPSRWALSSFEIPEGINGRCQKLLQDWLDLRKAQKLKAYKSNRWMNAAWKTCEFDEGRLIAMLEHSLAQEYQGLFEPNGKQPKAQQGVPQYADPYMGWGKPE